MGFLEFLKGAVKILVAGAIALAGFFVSSSLMVGGRQLIGGVVLVIAFIAGLYVVYEREQQSKRV